MKEFTKGKELIRPGITRFATAYLTLARLQEQKGALISMFSSEKWLINNFTKSEQGKKVGDIILDTLGFWVPVARCLKAAVPLVKVLQMVDSDSKPAMGFIYNAMDCAKEEIKANFKNVQSRYRPIFEIIDERWQNQLHRPLHAAAYFLNPQMQYSASFKSTDVKVKRGLYSCLERLCANDEEIGKIDCQLDEFKNAKGLFGLNVARKTRNKKSPVDWWDSYGDEVPELKRFAMRVLSLTCSSSGCERNWSAFEMVHSKRRNRLHQQKMNDLVYVMYNLKLRQRKERRETVEMEKLQTMNFDEMNSDDEWITEKEAPVLPTDQGWIDFLDKAAELEVDSEGGDEDFLERTITAATFVDLDKEKANERIDPLEGDYNCEVGGGEEEDLAMEEDNDVDANAGYVPFSVLDG